MASILLGLLSAISWGAGDFTGGLAARKVGAYRSVFYAEVIGIIFLFTVLAFVNEPLPDVRARMFAMLRLMQPPPRRATRLPRRFLLGGVIEHR